jgi:hypothetical protein
MTKTSELAMFLQVCIKMVTTPSDADNKFNLNRYLFMYFMLRQDEPAAQRARQRDVSTPHHLKVLLRLIP